MGPLGPCLLCNMCNLQVYDPSIQSYLFQSHMEYSSEPKCYLLTRKYIFSDPSGSITVTAKTDLTILTLYIFETLSLQSHIVWCYARWRPNPVYHCPSLLKYSSRSEAVKIKVSPGIQSWNPCRKRHQVFHCTKCLLYIVVIFSSLKSTVKHELTLNFITLTPPLPQGLKLTYSVI